MKVGILGSGDVGQALGRGFASRGHQVKIGSRTPESERLKAWIDQTGGEAATGTFAEAAVHGKVIVLATLGAATEVVIDIGGIVEARWIEAFVPLWGRVGMALETWDHAFKVLHD